MKKIIVYVSIILATIAMFGRSTARAHASISPNIIFILADDMQ